MQSPTGIPPWRTPLALGLIALVMILALSFLPQMWIRSVIQRHSAERADIPGTGAEFARHLLDRLKLDHVGVEKTDAGDHYDPATRTVRLMPAHHDGHSLAAIVIAAHEIGHAMQDATGYAPLTARTRMAKQAHRLQQIGVVLMMAAPLLVILARSPAILVVELGGAFLILTITIAMHVVTLPVEFDASFRRALPLLKAGNYIPDKDMPAARQILRAAAFTYVAAAAMTLLDVMRWMRVLRF